jgi:hypothetical protein
MSQSITAAKKSIGELLGTSERRPVVLPQFQRPYSWERAQVAAFWSDLFAFLPKYRKNPIEASYFLGPVVILDDTKEVIVLDGQQRLATSTILLAKIRDIARGLKAKQEGADFARDLQRDFIEKTEAPITYALTLSELDEPFFRSTIKADPSSVEKPTLRSHLLIRGAGEFFTSSVEAEIEGVKPADAIEVLKDIKNALTKAMTLVAITVKDEEDAFDIFESLNDRGLRLSVPDLVINLLLRRCPDNPTRNTVRQKWNDVLQELGKKDVSRFLRHLWISRFGDIKTRGLYSEIKTYLSEKKLTSLSFAQSCADEAETYVALLEKTVSISKQARRNLEGLLDYLAVQNALPLLLSGQLGLTRNDFEKLLRAVISIYVRHTLVSNQNPLELETAFYDAAREIRAKYESKVPSAKCLAAAKSILNKLNPADALIEETVGDLLLSRAQACWFVTELANGMQSQTKEIGMDKANLEHIFPQNAGADWPNRDKLEPFIWHVGNLTVLSNRLNSKARNSGFATKSKQYYSKSEIRMTRELTKVKAWDEKAILDRAKQLGQQIIRTWS